MDELKDVIEQAGYTLGCGCAWVSDRVSEQGKSVAASRFPLRTRGTVSESYWICPTRQPPRLLSIGDGFFPTGEGRKGKMDVGEGGTGKYCFLRECVSPGFDQICPNQSRSLTVRVVLLVLLVLYFYYNNNNNEILIRMTTESNEN